MHQTTLTLDARKRQLLINALEVYHDYIEDYENDDEAKVKDQAALDEMLRDLGAEV